MIGAASVALAVAAALLAQPRREPQPEVPAPVQESSPSADPWLSFDKGQHFAMSYAVTVFTYGALRSGADHDTAALGGVGAAALAGLGKELYDRRSGGAFSLRDLAWDALGIIAATLLIRELR